MTIILYYYCIHVCTYSTHVWVKVTFPSPPPSFPFSDSDKIGSIQNAAQNITTSTAWMSRTCVRACVAVRSSAVVHYTPCRCVGLPQRVVTMGVTVTNKPWVGGRTAMSSLLYHVQYEINTHAIHASKSEKGCGVGNNA